MAESPFFERCDNARQVQRELLFCCHWQPQPVSHSKRQLTRLSHDNEKMVGGSLQAQMLAHDLLELGVSAGEVCRRCNRKRICALFHAALHGTNEGLTEFELLEVNEDAH